MVRKDLQFASRITFRCARHRYRNRVIHRSGLYAQVFFHHRPGTVGKWDRD